MYLPLLFKENLSCLIIGGGQVATRKVETLCRLACSITVIAPEVTEPVELSIRAGAIRWIRREYVPGDCRGFQLVIAATPVREVNRRVSGEARELGIPVNVVDDPELSTFIFPAVWRDRSLIIAVSTEGVAPFMAAEIRNRLSEQADQMGRWVEMAGNFREIVRSAIDDSGEREELYRRFASAGPPPEDSHPPANSRLEDWLTWIDSFQIPSSKRKL
jgi:uroporphyrin-III C-methyltransferase/precorrin-2 dehydrogenase/sirohydrochlorin ferrochelatase